MDEIPLDISVALEKHINTTINTCSDSTANTCSDSTANTCSDSTANKRYSSENLKWTKTNEQRSFTI